MWILGTKETETKPLQEPASQDGRGNQIQQLHYQTAYDSSHLVLEPMNQVPCSSQLMHVSDGKEENRML